MIPVSSLISLKTARSSAGSHNQVKCEMPSALILSPRSQLCTLPPGIVQRPPPSCSSSERFNISVSVPRLVLRNTAQVATITHLPNSTSSRPEQSGISPSFSYQRPKQYFLNPNTALGEESTPYETAVAMRHRSQSHR